MLSSVERVFAPGLSTRIFQAAPAMSLAAPAMSHVAHFADEIMVAISNFPQLDRVKLLPPARCVESPVHLTLA
jgi:hypothetical protein